MDKKKVLTILSVLGLSGSLMFSVSALSADSLVGGASVSPLTRDTPPPSCSNPDVADNNPNCGTNSSPD